MAFLITTSFRVEGKIPDQVLKDIQQCQLYQPFKKFNKNAETTKITYFYAGPKPIKLTATQ